MFNLCQGFANELCWYLGPSSSVLLASSPHTVLEHFTHCVSGAFVIHCDIFKASGCLLFPYFSRDWISLWHMVLPVLSQSLLQVVLRAGEHIFINPFYRLYGSVLLLHRSLLVQQSCISHTFPFYR